MTDTLNRPGAFGRPEALRANHSGHHELDGSCANRLSHGSTKISEPPEMEQNVHLFFCGCNPNNPDAGVIYIGESW